MKEKWINFALSKPFSEIPFNKIYTPVQFEDGRKTFFFLNIKETFYTKQVEKKLGNSLV